MELHLHLSVAFRALDRKWGKPVDLDHEEESVTCIPAVVDNDTTTFSSEEYLKAVRRIQQKPYLQSEGRRKTKINKCDSFSNISVTRLSSSNDFCSTEENLSDCKVQWISNDINSEVTIGKMKKKKGLDFLKQVKVPSLFKIKTKGKQVCNGHM